MAAAIETEFDVTPELVGGGGGIFEVYVDGDLVYTNNREGGVPPADEVLAPLQAALQVTED